MAEEQPALWGDDPWNYSAWDGHRFDEAEIACGRCRFWERMTGSEMGQCRRHAPRASAAFDEDMLEAAFANAGVEKDTTEVLRCSYWPQTSNYDRCGEFVLRSTPPKEMPR
jgi:hypothetical protein